MAASVAELSPSNLSHFGHSASAVKVQTAPSISNRPRSLLGDDHDLPSPMLVTTFVRDGLSVASRETVY
jgi:hypothetical protein